VNGHRDRLIGIRIAVLLAPALIALACTIPPLQPAPTATPPVIEELPTSLPETPASVPEPPPSAPAADVIFHNGAILTMEADRPQAQAVAIQGENILAVGSDEEILALRGPETEVVDLQGRALMPGFVDAHTHLFAATDHYGTDLQGVQDLALMNGITTLADIYVTPELLEQMQTFAQAGRLRVRTSLYLAYIDGCGEVVGDWYREHPPTRVPGEMLRIGGVKIFSDGGSCGAPAVSFEYPNGVGQGDLFFTQEEMNGVVAELQANGYQAAIHALGDRAVEQVQNAIAAALGGQPNTLRHRIEHNGVLRPDLMPRYSEIGIVPLIMGKFPTCWRLGGTSEYQYAIPVEYQAWEWPWRELLDANPGLTFAWHGDDPPLPPINPLVDLYGLVTRRDIAEDGSICEPPDWLAANAITVEEALPIMTMGSAYALFRDEEVGSLKPGKFADVIILSEDPSEVDPNTIKDVAVLMTMVGGRVEYCAPGHEALCPAP
jgi:predicted amidohydrolase YtcJ